MENVGSSISLNPDVEIGHMTTGMINSVIAPEVKPWYQSHDDTKNNNGSRPMSRNKCAATLV